MPSRRARLHKPIIRLIGKGLARQTNPKGMRTFIDRVSRTLLPARGVTIAGGMLGPSRTLEISASDSTPTSQVLMFHGGGYVFGSPEMYRWLAGRIARAADAQVNVPQYRLAPENTFPAAVEDGLAAYRAMLERTAPDQLVIGGDSAGGGLSVAVLQAAQAEGLPMPAGMFLIAPWLDHTGDAEGAMPTVDTEILILPESVIRSSGWYRGDHPASDPGISPLLGSLDGLPPMLIQVSDNEVLYGESVAFADQARAAGIPVDLQVGQDLWHVWHLMAPTVPEALASIQGIGDFIKSVTGSTSS